MGILDEAIREHLELKRQHGAGDSELKKLEDEAFGPPERPGAEAVETAEAAEAAEPFAEAPTEFMAQPEEAASSEGEGNGEAPAPRRAPDVADLQEPPEAEQAEEEPPPLEHEAIAPPEPPAGPSTEEREAIAEQPTELYDVEEDLTAGEPHAPSEEELVEEEIGEPRLAPVDPLAAAGEEEEEEESEAEPEPEPEPGEEEEDEDFWSEQRLSEELDQALETPEEEDLLDETPDFLEEAPEDDELWFEQKPPKDFDFDD